ncbi:EamA family transporter [Microcella alkaliphila]|uniref:DMT superfamily protein n=1 Tax=Microcella alkaliphila TaxID=279828 RepID=A0A0U5BP67_9MICO|nr:DMT superfamily protein [Microcella alkaliphila]
MSVLERGAARATAATPPWTLAVAAMLMIQLGSALSAALLIPELGAGGTAWLRLTLGAIILVAIARPPLRSIRRSDVLPLLGLGVATGLMTVFFLAALARIPLGIAVAIEFLGPLAVAALRRPSGRALAWPLLALAGVVLMTEPWRDTVDPIGVLFAALAGTGWGIYIVLTQKVGDRFSGIRALSITIPIAALTAALIGVPQAVGSLRLEHLIIGAGLALLVPVVPFALEMVALRRMTATAFGTLMAVEPAIGLVIGMLVLLQVPGLAQIAGIALVVIAGAAAQRGGRRSAPPLAAQPT